MAADLGLVAHAAEREAHELPVQRAGDGLRERGLPDARRPDEADDRALRLLDELADRQELEDPLLDLLEAVVVVVQDLLGAGQVLGLAGGLLPGHAHEPLDVVARDRGLRGHRGHRFQPPQLLLGLLADFLGHAGGLDLLLELLDLVRPVVLPPELLMDGLDLLVEVVLLLGLLHLLLDLVVDPAVDVDLVDLDLQQVLEPLETLVRRLGLEKRLLLGGGDGEMGRQRVGEALGVVDLERRREPLEREVVRELGVLLEERQHLAHVVLEAFGVDRAHREDLDRDGEVRPPALEGHDAAAAHALDHHLDVAVGKLQGLGDGGDDADFVDVLRRRIVELRVALRRQEEPLHRRRESRFEGANRGFAAHDEGLHHVREHDHVPKGDERQAFQAAAAAIGFHLGSTSLSGVGGSERLPLIPPCAGW